MDLEQLKDDFELLSDWEDRYSYIIDLGKALPPMDISLKIEDNKVNGCTSQVWMATTDKSSSDSLDFVADSDAIIVRGLVAVLMIIYNGKSKEEIKNIDIHGVFSNLGLDSHLSVNRRNGFFSMVSKITTD